VICIVDDDSWARAGLEDLLLSFGYKTRAFDSAQSFLESRVVDEAACLITDLHMPGINGLDLQRVLRREGHDIPVILVTAYPNDAHRADAFGDGALAFLTKPYDEQVLMDCLARVKCGSGRSSAS